MGLRGHQLRRLLFVGAMSRWRKRVAKGAKSKKSAKRAKSKKSAKGEKLKKSVEGAELGLSFGDLVMVKGKGFPPWPAKISRPEKWGLAPDPKKYFVDFFGTGEIAYIPPVDVRPFTNELKNKLLAKCAGKTLGDWANAVKEICEAFDELQQKHSHKVDKSVLGPGGPSADEGEAEVKDASGRVGSNQETEATPLIDHGAGLEHCLPNLDAVGCHQVEPEASSSFPLIN